VNGKEREAFRACSYEAIMSTVRPIDSKFNKIPSLPDLDPRTSEYVYFVESDTERKLIKIGRSESLKRRLIALQASCPVQLRLIAAIRAPAGTENLFHAILAPARVHGEWFQPTVEVIALAKYLPKMGTLTHEQVRDIAEAGGVRPGDVSRAFTIGGKAKRRHPRIRYGRLVFA
jgi:hypothetical protein